MLDGGVSVAEVAEVVDVAGGEEHAGGEGVDWCVAPLWYVLANVTGGKRVVVRTRSIQNPPLRSIIWKKSSYSLLLNQLSLAISKLDQ